MKRYIVALVMLMCAWAWCADIELWTVTEDGAVIKEGHKVIEDRIDGDVIISRPYEFEIIRAEMIAALKEATEKYKKSGASVTGYRINGAMAELHYYFPLSEDGKKHNADPNNIYSIAVPSYGWVIVYPPELVEMIEGLTEGEK